MGFLLDNSFCRFYRHLFPGEIITFERGKVTTSERNPHLRSLMPTLQMIGICDCYVLSTLLVWPLATRIHSFHFTSSRKFVLCVDRSCPLSAEKQTTGDLWVAKQVGLSLVRSPPLFLPDHALPSQASHL